MTLRELEERLSSAGIANAQTEAAILVGHFCGVPFSHVPMMRDSELASAVLDDAVNRRLSGEPLQYILGK